MGRLGCCCGPPRRIVLRVQRERPHRISNVLDLLFALVGETGTDLAAHRAVNGVGNRDAARLGQALQPRCDVDTVAIHRAVGLLDHIPQVDADAKAHAAVLGHRLGQGVDLLLDRQCSGDRAGGGLEHRQHRVARHVDHAALIALYLREKQRACRVQCRHRGAIVARHQA